MHVALDTALAHELDQPQRAVEFLAGHAVADRRGVRVYVGQMRELVFGWQARHKVEKLLGPGAGPVLGQLLQQRCHAPAVEGSQGVKRDEVDWFVWLEQLDAHQHLLDR